jgi:hypothetical protein
LGRDIGYPANQMLRSHFPTELLGGVNPVLDRQHDGLWSHEEMKSFTGRTGVIRFDAEQHQVDCSDLLRIARRMDWKRKRSGKARLHGQTACAQGLQLCPSCQEADLLANPGEQPSKVPTGSSGSYDNNTYLLSPSKVAAIFPFPLTKYILWKVTSQYILTVIFQVYTLV